MAENDSTNEVRVEELDALYEAVLACEPMIPPEQMNELADLVFNKGLMIRPWRLAAFVGSQSGAFYREISTDEEKARWLAAGVEPMMDAAKRLREMADIMESAATRVATAGCNHENFLKWVKEPSA